MVTLRLRSGTTLRRIILLAMLLAVAGLGMAKEFYTLPQVPDVQGRDIYLLRRPAAIGFDNNTGSRNITGGNLLAVFANHSTAWSKIAGVPTVFSPTVHGSRHAAAGSDPLTLTVGQVTGLQPALDGKAATSHTQAAGTITGLATVATSGSYPDLFNKPAIPAACVNVFDGAPGIQGIQGIQGVAGLDGKSVLNGTSDPAAGIGTDGDFFLNTTTATLFGPKVAGAWPAGISLVGPPGEQGPPGPPGTVDQATILGEIAIPTAGAILEVQQAVGEASTNPKLIVNNDQGASTFYVDGAGTLTIKKLVIQ